MQPLSKGETLFDVGHPLEEAVPTDFSVKKAVVGIEREPHEERFAHDVVFGDETPEARVGGVVAVVAHHPVVVHLEGIAVGALPVDEDVAAAHFEAVLLDRKSTRLNSSH